jgi:hypothetical protein
MTAFFRVITKACFGEEVFFVADNYLHPAINKAGRFPVFPEGHCSAGQ